MESFELTREQVRTIAAGLYTLAASDGVDSRELQVIQTFVTDAGYPDLVDGLATLHFDPAAAFHTLESSWLRRLFLKAALVLIRADGQISKEERDAFAYMAVAFGISGGVDALITETEGAVL